MLIELDVNIFVKTVPRKMSVGAKIAPLRLR
jgi:hypothetical protein